MSKGLLADGEEPTDSTPRIAAPVEVEFTLRAATEEVGHAAITIPIEPRRAEGDHGELPLDVGVGRPERQELLDGRGTQTQPVELRFGIVRPDHAVEVDELEVNLDGALALDGEVTRVDVGGLPVVLALGDHILDLLPEVDRDGVVRGLALGQELSDLIGGDSVVHLFHPCICRQTILHPTPCRAYYCQYRTDTALDWRKSPAFFWTI